MTAQNQISIFDALIKPFLRDDSQTSEHQEDNLFAPAIRQLINSSLRAQQDEHLGCERYERMPTRNGQRNDFKPRTIRTSTGQITLDVPQVKNAQAHVTSVRYRSIAAAHIRNVFNAGNRASAKLMIQNVLSIFRADKQYKPDDWFEENIEECLTVIDCPPEVQQRLRTSNIMESINRQLKRRTNIISIFPSEASTNG